ncbi:MAG: prenyltransferase [Halanaerobiales bacterium]
MMENKRKRIWKGFWQLADPKIWIASTIPMLIGAAMAFSRKGRLNIYWFIWTIIGIYMIEIGKNAINEIVDYKSGVDRYVTPEERTPFSGGKKTIVDGLLNTKETKIIAFLTMTAGSLIGLYICFYHEPSIIWIGLSGFIFSIIYSVPPFKLAYRGLGELTVGLTFGPLIVLGTYMVQTGSISLPVILVSLPVGFLIANVLWINQYPDYKADKKGKKYNWVVRLGKQKGVKIYALLFAASYLSLIIITIFTGNPIWLLPFVSLPLVYQAVKVAGKHYDNIAKLIKANARTVQVYQIFGLCLIIAAIAEKFI